MSRLERVVIDTNVLVSAALFQGSTPHRALLKARSTTVLLGSDETLAEFHRVLMLPKFDKHVELAIRAGIVEEYFQYFTLVSILFPIRACRDPRDDKFLEAAIHGQADAIVTGDLDLLALDPFHGVRILTPAAFLEHD